MHVRVTAHAAKRARERWSGMPLDSLQYAANALWAKGPASLEVLEPTYQRFLAALLRRAPGRQARANGRRYCIFELQDGLPVLLSVFFLPRPVWNQVLRERFGAAYVEPPPRAAPR